MNTDNSSYRTRNLSEAASIALFHAPTGLIFHQNYFEFEFPIEAKEVSRRYYSGKLILNIIDYQNQLKFLKNWIDSERSSA